MNYIYPQKENILLVANWESDIGYAWWLMENFWVTIAEHFKKQGRDSYLVYPKITVIPDLISTSTIKPIELDFKNRSLENLIRIHHLIKRHYIKYIYLTDARTYSIFYLLLKLWGVKVIAIHDHTPGDRSPPYKLKKIIKTALQRSPLITADHFIAVTEFVYKRFIDVYCIPQYKCSYTSNGIVPVTIDNIDESYPYDLFNIPRNRAIVVTTGRASYYKGIDFFIECANKLINIDGLNKLHFLYCGSGPDLTDFKLLVEKYNLNSYFTFAGNRKDIRKILPSCYIGFHAATGEVGYSLSILEYMSAGLLTIVPNKPSTSLTISSSENGFLYEFRNLISATNTIKLALNHKDSGPIRQNATKLVRKKYNIKQTNRGLIQILERVFL